MNADGTLGIPENLGPNVNSIGRENFPFIDQDDHLYFSSTGRNTLGGFVAKLKVKAVAVGLFKEMVRI